MSQPTAQPITIYPRSVKGRFRNFKTFILILAYSVYFLLPWVRWERAGQMAQAVLFDIPGRKFYIFDMIVYPQDIFWLAGFLIVGAFLLFFVTAVAGRAFCGYFCFQTLWTDFFMLTERFIQGEKPARNKLDKLPWTSPKKLFKKGLTHIVWLLAAFLTGLTFVIYWGDAPTIVQQFFHLLPEDKLVYSDDFMQVVYGTTFLLTATTYIIAGTIREKLCGYMCPYARFQSAMFDRDTLIVGYDTKRGEGKNGRAKRTQALKTLEDRHENGVGDCIDCGYCVQVCPTGIDIRDGLQLQCISCALCIDACDSIMESLNWPKGLVSYSSEEEFEGGKTHIIKPKSIGYAAVLVFVFGILIWGMAHQAPLELLIVQQRQPLYVLLSDGSYQNSYELKINNKTDETVPFKITIEGLEGAMLDLGEVETFVLEPEKIHRYFVRVRYSPDHKTKNHQYPFSFRLTPTELEKNSKIEELNIETVFYAPIK